ncbi:glutathione S-transferase-like protein [Sarocladium strictum]
MTYTLFIGNKRYSSWSMRPSVLLKALNIPFEERLFFFNDGIAQPQFKAFSPSSKVPCLHVHAADSNDDPLIVWDSLAIIEHIADDHPAVWPSKDKPAARAFARSAAAEMHSGFSTLRNELNMNVGLRFERQTPSEDLQKDLDRISALFKHGLETFGGPWLAGDAFTGADAFYAPVASRLKTYGLELGDEKAQEYVERLFECPAVREWVEDGIRETAREPMHEEECRQGRKLIADLSAEASQ